MTQKQPFSKTVSEIKNVFFDSFLGKNIVLVQAIGITPIIAA